MPQGDRDKLLMVALTYQVRGFLANQVATLFDLRGERRTANAERSLRRLVEKEWLEVERIHIRPLPPITGPIWRSGEEASLLKLEYEIQSRFTEPARRVNVYRASKKGAAVTGGAWGTAKATQWQHDLHVSEILTWLYRERPKDAQAFLGEDQYASNWSPGKLPDGLCFRDGKPYLAIESAAGSYTAKRLAAFASDMERRQIPFEVF